MESIINEIPQTISVIENNKKKWIQWSLFSNSFILDITLPGRNLRVSGFGVGSICINIKVLYIVNIMINV